jgi:hypothetical protein
MNFFRGYQNTFSKPSNAMELRPIVAHGATVGLRLASLKSPGRGDRKIRRLIFCRPCRGLDYFDARPTVAPWAIFFRDSVA